MSLFIGIDFAKDATVDYEKLKRDVELLIRNWRGYGPIEIEVSRIFDRYKFDDNLTVSKELANLIVNYYKKERRLIGQHLINEFNCWINELAWLPNFALELKILSNMEKTEFYFDF